jgi:hypothetical protein
LQALQYTTPDAPHHREAELPGQTSRLLQVVNTKNSKLVYRAAASFNSVLSLFATLTGYDRTSME